MNFYRFFCTMMLIGYFAVAIQVPGWRMKLTGILLTIVNGLIFWR